MKSEDYFEHVAGEIRDRDMRSRFLEELQEHWEDVDGPADADPSATLGESALLSHQVNAVVAQRSVGWSIALMLFSCFVTWILGSTISAYIPKFTFSFVSLAELLTFTLWLVVAFALYVTVHHRLAMYPSTAKARAIPCIVAFFAPLGFTMYELVPPLLTGATGYDISYSIRGFASGAALLVMFLLAGEVVRRYLHVTDRIIGSVTRWLPWFVAVYVTIGCAMLIWNNALSDGPGAILAAPFVVPLFVAYLCWALLSTAPMTLLPVMMGFWLVTAAAITLGILVPVGVWIARRRLAFPLRLALGFTLPIFLILPFVPQDVPVNTWQVPVVWSWDSLERSQLNVVYPWAASLMRRNDGMNASYGAEIENGSLRVIQAGGVVVTFEDRTPVVRANKEVVDDAIYNDFPTSGFACDGTLLETIWDTHNDSTSPMGMFGSGCGELTYNGHVIGTIDHALIELDMSSDGLLAVSINMGSYDPTYVYVLDISQLQ